MKQLIKNFLFKYIHRHWNIAIAELDEDLTPKNVKWMKHNYKDRWFADPFIINEANDAFIILAEEYMRDAHKARLARLTVSKKECNLIKNETILELPTHLSFPIFVNVEDKTFIYPENGQSGSTFYYEYDNVLRQKGELAPLPLADAVIEHINNQFFLFFTMGKECNGNKLIVYSSAEPFGQYKPFQKIVFDDNIARRAGRMFSWNGKLISPAQVCNNAYGEGVSLQEVKFNNNQIEMQEIKRFYPTSKEYPNGLHTFNVYGEHVVIDGYKFQCPFLSKLYFRSRGGAL